MTLDGKPLANKALMFLPIDGTQGRGARGWSDAEGAYTLDAVVPGAINEYQGVPPGRYRVTVSEPLLPIGGSHGAEDGPMGTYSRKPSAIKQKIPAVYSSAERTPLKVDVPESGGKIDLDLKSNPTASGV